MDSDQVEFKVGDKVRIATLKGSGYNSEFFDIHPEHKNNIMIVEDVDSEYVQLMCEETGIWNLKRKHIKHLTKLERALK